MTDRRALLPGEIAGLAIVAIGVGISATLRSRGHDTISTCGRRVLVGRTLALYLGLHVAFDLGRWDPLGYLDRLIFPSIHHS